MNGGSRYVYPTFRWRNLNSAEAERIAVRTAFIYFGQALTR